ncbi:MAG: HPr family phosphocarrier protein [Elusimicrobiaceae bacterium]|nr:HPr family phosphocarrier protein [Elusimicrobiaceae bacterium]MBR5609051.1 HPr family phosphocarrier protein [Elusimicrobiaceae bacterium]
MKEFSYVIQDKDGIHARPAGVLVKIANGFKSQVAISKAEKKGDLKRIFSVMALGAKQGDTVTVRVEGEDEVQAAAALEEALKNNL